MGSGVVRGDAIELVHYHVGGDGERALEAFLAGYRETHATDVEPTSYDNTRLQVKSRILGGDPPDVWTGWPGKNLQAYADANVLADVTEIFESTGMAANYREAALAAARIDDAYRAVPYSIHRINDLYLNVGAVEAIGFDPEPAGTPRELASLVSDVAERTDTSPFLLPMKEPWPVLQLWEVVLLGQYDHATFEAVTGGRAGDHRDEIRASLDVVATLAAAAPEDAVYTSLVEANERFVAGEAPLYPQGDWAGGVFVESPEFTYGDEWRRIPFPGTEDMYVVVMDAMTPSHEADIETLRPFLEYAGSPDGQVAFTRAKGSLPTRTDCSTDSFSAFGREQADALDAAHRQPQSIAHGLSVTPRTRIELLDAFASFITTWDCDVAANDIVTALDG